MTSPTPPTIEEEELIERMLAALGLAGKNSMDRKIIVRDPDDPVLIHREEPVRTVVVRESDFVRSEIRRQIAASVEQSSVEPERYDHLLKNIEKLCGDLLPLLEALPAGDHELLWSLSPDSRDLLHPVVADWKVACSSTRSRIRGTSTRQGVERPDARTLLVHRLVVLFERHYRKRRSGSGSEFAHDREDFVRAGLKLAGDSKIPKPDQLNRGYIRPAIRMVRKHLRAEEQILEADVATDEN
jgi:hypothetical protein